MNLEEWIEGVFNRLKLARRPLHHKTSLGEVEGIVEIGCSKKSLIITAAYSIHSDEFDKLLFGRKSDGGMIIAQCGDLSNINKQVYAYPNDPSTFRRMSETIMKETALFFTHLNTLSKVYAELIALRPNFIDADPRSPSLRQLHAAVVARLLSKPWRRHVEEALNSKTPLSVQWVRDVEARLTGSTIRTDNFT